MKVVGPTETLDKLYGLTSEIRKDEPVERDREAEFTADVVELVGVTLIGIWSALESIAYALQASMQGSKE